MTEQTHSKIVRLAAVPSVFGTGDEHKMTLDGLDYATLRGHRLGRAGWHARVLAIPLDSVADVCSPMPATATTVVGTGTPSATGWCSILHQFLDI